MIDDRLPILMVLLDGLGDRGCPSLNGQTPAEAANTPLLDSLTAKGVSALHVPFGPGRSTSSETAHWDLFGFANQPFAGRALLEALGQGLQPPMNTPLFQVALRCGKQLDGKIRLGARAKRGRDEDDAAALFSALQGQRIDGIDFELLPLRTGECVLVAHNGPSHQVSDSDALFDHIHPWMQPLAWRESREPAAAQAMASALTHWLQNSYRLLSEHAINQRRTAEGLERLDVPVSKWASWHSDALPSFKEQVGIQGAAVTDTALYRGFARLLDMPFTDIAYDANDPATDMAQRVAAASALLDDSPFVHLHIKATDEAGHSKIPERKRDVIEATERGLAGLTDISERAIVVITGDHATPSTGTLLHSGDPTPLVVAGPGIRADRVQQFGERHARDGDYGLLGAADVLPLLAGFANRPFFRGHRPGASTTLALPDHPPSMPLEKN